MSRARDLFVFCGQSNMMGACDFPPKHELNIKDSYEFKFKEEYLGRGSSHFQTVSYDVGEFLYCDRKKAYPNGEEKSALADYHPNAYFVPSMAGLRHPFAVFSEADYTPGSTLLPYFCESYEKYGESPLTAHMAKGAVPIEHYFNAEMAEKYNRLKAPQYKEMTLTAAETGANKAFTEKSLAFFRESERQFGPANKKVFVWNQGENNFADSEEEYLLKLELLWEYIRSIGYDLLFCLRVGYWFRAEIINVIRAQERFCREQTDCYMVSRSYSFMPHAGGDPKGWFKEPPSERYMGCRDTFNGTQNAHINEKGFLLVGAELAENAYRILKEGKAPILPEELLSEV